MPMKYQLNYSTIDQIRPRFGICSTLIDLFHIKHYKGRAHTSHGRTIISIALIPQSYIIIDKDHSTRYFVQEIVQYVEHPSENYPGVLEKEIISFRGYKMELDKYMIHGYFEMFEMREYSAYFGFDYVNLTMEEYQDMRGMKGVEKNGDIATLLFCKVQKQGIIAKYYFDCELNVVKEIAITEPSVEVTQYFSQTIFEKSLNNLNNNEFVNTKVLNYFFSRLMFSYYSQFWYKGKERALIKALQSQSLTFFYKNKESLDFQEFYNKLYHPYDLMGKDPLGEQRLIILPIYDGNQHFVLGAIKVEDKVIGLYELDPLQGKKGVWRDRLGLMINQSMRILKENNVEIPEYTIQVLSSLECIHAPRQQGGSNCGIFICIYSLLLMQKLCLISLSEQLVTMCKAQQRTAQLATFMRKFIYYSYTRRNLHLLPSLQDKSFQFYLNMMRE